MLEHVVELPLFAFGSHLESEFISHMLERPMDAEPADLLDFELLELAGLDASIPLEAPGKKIRGRIYRYLSAEDYVRLDAYQGVAEGLYQRVVGVVAAGEPEASGAAREGAFVYLPTDQTITRYG